MIRGRLKKYPDYYPEEIREFLSLIDSADVTYIRKTNGSNEIYFSENEFRFNGNIQFERRLIGTFELAKNAVKKYIAQFNSKTETLFAINDLITEISTVKDFLSCEKGFYFHIHTSYRSDLDYKDLTHLGKKTNIQRHLLLIKEYSDKFFNFLDTLRVSYFHKSEEDILLFHSEREFKIFSSEKTPLRFLDYLLSDDWRQHLFRLFYEKKISEESQKIDFSHDTEVLSYIETEQTTGDDKFYEIQFSDYLSDFVKFQIIHSYSASEAYLSNSEDKFQAEHRLKNLLSRLEHFIITFRTKENKASYELVINLVIEFALGLIKKYPHYLTQEDRPEMKFMILRLNEDVNSSNSQDKNNKGTSSLPPRVYFKWNSMHPLPLTLILFKGLVDNGFIKDDDFEVFSQLFSGEIESIKSPIRWNNNVKSKRGPTGLTNLLYLFNQLSIKDLFSSRFEENELEAAIKSCFVSDGGKQIMSFASARQENKRKLGSNNLTEQQIQINMIIGTLLESNSQ